MKIVPIVCRIRASASLCGLSLLLFTALAVISSCKKDDIPDQREVSYGSDPKQKMDIYLPSGRNESSTKVLIMIHGGAWVEGDKTDFNSFIPAIQQKLPGYAIFNINYRLVSNGANLFPAQEDDIKKAIEFVYNKRAEYRISDKFIYLGASAGAHLALLLGFKYSSPVKPKAVVSFYAPINLIDLYNANATTALILSQVTGATPATDPAIYQQSSPSSFVSTSSPPAILLQGGVDPLVPFSQADSFDALLTAATVPHKYVFYPAEGHGWTGATLDDSMNQIAAFLAVQVP